MKCSGKVYGMRVSMTQQSENFQGVIFTTITHSINQKHLLACYLVSERHTRSKVSCSGAQRLRLDNLILTHCLKSPISTIPPSSLPLFPPLIAIVTSVLSISFSKCSRILWCIK